MITITEQELKDWRYLLVLNVSTAHMTKFDDELFDSVHESGDFPIALHKLQYGWEINLASIRDDMGQIKDAVDAGMSIYLAANILWALNATKASHLRFDPDAKRHETMTTHSW